MLESHKPHDMDSLAWRAPRREDDHLRRGRRQGREADRLRPGRASTTRPRTRRRTPTSRCSCTTRCYPRLARGRRGSTHVYATIELPVREVLFRMERDGRADRRGAARARRAASWASACWRSSSRRTQLAGQPFNLASPKQLGEILFERMKLPVVKKTATGQPSTDEEVLQELAADYPLPKLLLEHRALSKLKSTYTDKLPQMVNPRTGRVHTTLRAGDRGHRPARVDRPQPAEHPGAHRRRPAHPRGVHRAAGPRAGVGRLLADRAADHGAPVRRPGAA